MSAIICQHCQQPFTSKRKDAKFCSDACRKAAARSDGMLPADRAYKEHTAHMPDDWLVFEAEPEEHRCINCKKKFLTRLKLLRDCGCT